MKQVAQNYRSGELSVLDVPIPSSAPGGVLVRSLFSLISTGTELMKVDESKLSLLGKARARPDQVKKVLETVQQQGPVSAYKKAMNRLDSYTPLGYSLAGVVVDVGHGAEEFSRGQLVACAGNEFALHAEYNWVPRNLCVPVPQGVAPQLAAFATVGAIALQGVRQAETQLGDVACVIGLGLVGQLVVQLLVAAGVRVIGLDTVAERCRLAEKAGALAAASPDQEGLQSLEQVLHQASSGIGADKIFLVAGGASNDPVEIAARLARDRATVIDIGKCSLNLPWNAYYEKELDLRFSRSYGPGRYDDRYELEGVDYPAGYVRWTERRNLECFLGLVASGAIDPQPLVSGCYPVADAVGVYERLQSGALKGVAFLFEYPELKEADSRIASPPGVVADTAAAGVATLAPATQQRRDTFKSGHATPLHLGFIGAGNYASSMLLPHLVSRPEVLLSRVATRRALSAVNAKRKFGFDDAGTNVDDVVSDDGLDTVFITTRHSSHATLVCQALAAGKAVFVEKPLALNAEELEKVASTAEATGNYRLMVGFNRRFAPLLVELRERFGRSNAPLTLRYLVSAGKLGADSWYRDVEHEGTRFVGEGGHFIDTLSWWIGCDPVAVSAFEAGGDGVEAVLRYPDGSLATVTYVTDGHPRFPKETLEVSGGGRSARFDNFRRGTVWTGRRQRTSRGLSPDKGQRHQLEAFLQAVQNNRPMPIAFESLLATTRATLTVSAAVASGCTERI